MSKKIKNSEQESAAALRQRILGYFALIFVFLLPLKFGNLAGMPEVPFMYPDNIIGLLILPWPGPVFTVLSGGFLLMVAFDRLLSQTQAAPQEQSRLSLMTLLWVSLAIAGLFGMIRASTLDYAIHEEVHLFGIASFAVAACGLLQSQPKLRIPLLAAICAGIFCSSLSALYSLICGMEETRQFTYEQELKSGVKIAVGQFKTRMEENRVFGTFTICNSYAAHLALTIPICLWALWRAAGQVDPPKATRAIFLPLFGGFLLTMLFYTGSRGGIAALAIAAGVIFFCSVPLWLKKILFWTALAQFIMAAFAIHYWGRGFKSLLFRFDYWISAAKMFWAQPLTGTGWGDFFHEYMLIKQIEDNEASHMAHNTVLDFASQAGLFGLIAAVLVLSYPAYLGLRRLWKDSGSKFYFSSTLALSWGFLAWAIHSLTDINMQIPGTMATAAIISLILLMPEGIPPEEEKARRVEPGPGRRWKPAWAAAVALALFTCAGGIYLGLCEVTAGNLSNLCDPRFMTHDEFAAITPTQVEMARRNCEKLMPYSPFPWGIAADFIAHKGDPWTAERYYKEAIKRAPERPSFYHRLAMLQAYMGKRDEAEANMEMARKLFPKNSEYKRPLFKPRPTP